MARMRMNSFLQLQVNDMEEKDGMVVEPDKKKRTTLISQTRHN